MKSKILKDPKNTFFIGIIVGVSIIAIILLITMFASFEVKEEFNLTNKSPYMATQEYIDEVSKFYNYNSSNHGKELTFEELKEIGGNCKHYTDLYESMAREDGFYTKTPIIRKNNTATHIFTQHSQRKPINSLIRMNLCR